MKSVKVPEVETFDEDMGAARGFHVYSPAGYVGVVEAVRCGHKERRGSQEAAPASA